MLAPALLWKQWNTPLNYLYLNQAERQMSQHTLQTSELSPYSLKIEALLMYKQLPYRQLPKDGSWLESFKQIRAIEKGKKNQTITRYPQRTTLDEYPAVPYLISDGHIRYDSTGIGHWLDQQYPEHPLLPHSASLAFACQLIDEAFDEFGLYMVHHKRWVDSATDNTAGERLAAEFKTLLPFGLNRFMAVHFPKRQVRRLPYLFSVAPSGYQCGMPTALTPPSIHDWPETHSLLDLAWEQYLAALEKIFTHQPYVLGDAFTLADASIFGQLYMNMSDPSAANKMQQLAPTTYQWLENIRQGKHKTSTSNNNELYLSEHLTGLLHIILQTFVPLMQHNASAYQQAVTNGNTLFNERAFDRRINIYSGTLLGKPFNSVVKSFQVQVWRDLCASYQQLSSADKAALEALIDTPLSSYF